MDVVVLYTHRFDDDLLRCRGGRRQKCGFTPRDSASPAFEVLIFDAEVVCVCANANIP